MAPALSPIRGVEFYGWWKASKKPYRLSRHKNPGLEIVLVSKGELTWAVEDREVKLRAPALFYTLPWQEHGGVEESQPSCEISYLCLRLDKKYNKPRRQFGFHPCFGFTLAEERLISSALTANPRQAIRADSEAAWLFSRFFQIARERLPLRQSRARDAIKLMLTFLASVVARRRTFESQMAEAERRVRNLSAILAVRHAEPWTLKSMSDACGLGRTRFSQLLKKQTGDTPVTYLNRSRLREAERLLCRSTKSITEIAMAVGFNSSQYFATVFKEFYAVGPGTFRARGSRIE